MSAASVLLDALKARIAQVLGLRAEQVYDGDQPRDLTHNHSLEVWVEPLAARPAGAGVEVLPFALHLRTRALRLPLRAKHPEGKRLRDAQEQLRRALDGQRPFLNVLPQLVGLALQGGDLAAEDQTLDYELELTAVIHD